MAREAFTLVINNRTLKKIEEEEELMDELAKLEIVDAVKLTPMQAHYTKLVKAFRENQTTKKKLENANIKIRTRSG